MRLYERSLCAYHKGSSCRAESDAEKGIPWTGNSGVSIVPGNDGRSGKDTR